MGGGGGMRTLSKRKSDENFKTCGLISLAALSRKEANMLWDSVRGNCLHNQIPRNITYYFETNSITNYLQKSWIRIEYQSPFICELMSVKELKSRASLNKVNTN